MKVNRGRWGRKHVPKFAAAGIPEGGLGYPALGEGVSAECENAVGLRKGQGEGKGRTICFAPVICGGWWGELAGRCFPECFPRLWRTNIFFMVKPDGECCGPPRKVNCHRAPCSHGYKRNSCGMLSEVLGLVNVVCIFLQRGGVQFFLGLRCSGASYQGECKLC